MNAIEFGSQAWDEAWAALAAALAKQTLPAEGGGTVRCSMDDFMLMGSNAPGCYAFKDTTTRNYLYLLADGSLRIPNLGEPFHRGLYAHTEYEGEGARA